MDQIQVCSPIRFSNLRCNEVKATVVARTARTVMGRGKGQLYLSAPENIQQLTTLLLRDVPYVIHAHFEMTKRAVPGDDLGKFQDMLRRRIQKGQAYHQPYLGCREFPAKFRLCQEAIPCPEELKGNRELGWIQYDMDCAGPKNINPRFFRAVLRDGMLSVPPSDGEEVRR